MPGLPLYAARKGVLFIQSLPFNLLLLPGKYNGSGTWTGTDSAGTSGSNSLVDSGFTPPGLTSNYATFNGTSQKLTSTGNISGYVASGGATVISIVRFKAAAVGSDSLSPSVAQYCGHSSGYYGLYYGADGFTGVSFYCCNSSNSISSAVKSGASTNTWYLHIGRWDTSVRNRLNTTNSSPTSITSAGTNNTASGNVIIGQAPFGTYVNMDLRMVAIAPSAITDTDLTSIYNEASTQGWLT